MPMELQNRVPVDDGKRGRLELEMTTKTSEGTYIVVGLRHTPEDVVEVFDRITRTLEPTAFGTHPLCMQALCRSFDHVFGEDAFLRKHYRGPLGQTAVERLPADHPAFTSAIVNFAFSLAHPDVIDALACTCRRQKKHYTVMHTPSSHRRVEIRSANRLQTLCNYIFRILALIVQDLPRHKLLEVLKRHPLSDSEVDPKDVVYLSLARYLLVKNMHKPVLRSVAFWYVKTQAVGVIDFLAVRSLTSQEATITTSILTSSSSTRVYLFNFVLEHMQTKVQLLMQLKYYYERSPENVDFESLTGLLYAVFIDPRSSLGQHLPLDNIQTIYDKLVAIVSFMDSGVKGVLGPGQVSANESLKTVMEQGFAWPAHRIYKCLAFRRCPDLLPVDPLVGRDPQTASNGPWKAGHLPTRRYCTPCTACAMSRDA